MNVMKDSVVSEDDVRGSGTSGDSYSQHRVTADWWLWGLFNICSGIVWDLFNKLSAGTRHSKLFQWSFKSFLRLYFFSHALHSNSVLPASWIFICILKVSSRLKFLWQILHLNKVILASWIFMCLVKFRFCLYFFPHFVHWYSKLLWTRISILRELLRRTCRLLYFD